jgi:hypothetical protein
MALLTQSSVAGTFWSEFIQTQCLENTPPGGTCVIPAGDYPGVLTIDQPVELESAGGLVRIVVIEDQTNEASRLPPFVMAAATPLVVLYPDGFPLIRWLVDWSQGEVIEAALTAALSWAGMPPHYAAALADYLADPLASSIRGEVLPDGSAAEGGVTLQLPASYEYCRHVVQPTSINPEQDGEFRHPVFQSVRFVKKAPRYDSTLDTQRMRVWWQLTLQPDRTTTSLELHTLLVGVQHDLVDWARQNGYCTPLP